MRGETHDDSMDDDSYETVELVGFLKRFVDQSVLLRSNAVSSSQGRGIRDMAEHLSVRA